MRNVFQNVASAKALFLALTGNDLLHGLSVGDAQALTGIFEKRHPITHNLGIIDRKYLERAQTGELEGGEIRVTAAEVLNATVLAETVLRQAYQRVCG